MLEGYTILRDELDEYNAAYQTAYNGQPAPKNVSEHPHHREPFGTLIESYMRSPAYVGLHVTTKVRYATAVRIYARCMLTQPSAK